jgi:hypothetical protein
LGKLGGRLHLETWLQSDLKSMEEVPFFLRENMYQASTFHAVGICSKRRINRRENTFLSYR